MKSGWWCVEERGWILLERWWEERIMSSSLASSAWTLTSQSGSSDGPSLTRSQESGCPWCPVVEKRSPDPRLWSSAEQEETDPEEDFLLLEQDEQLLSPAEEEEESQEDMKEEDELEERGVGVAGHGSPGAERFHCCCINPWPTEEEMGVLGPVTSSLMDEWCAMNVLDVCLLVDCCSWQDWCRLAWRDDEEMRLCCCWKCCDWLWWYSDRVNALLRTQEEGNNPTGFIAFLNCSLACDNERILVWCCPVDAADRFDSRARSSKDLDNNISLCSRWTWFSCWYIRSFLFSCWYIRSFCFSCWYIRSFFFSCWYIWSWLLVPLWCVWCIRSFVLVPDSLPFFLPPPPFLSSSVSLSSPVVVVASPPWPPAAPPWPPSPSPPLFLPSLFFLSEPDPELEAVVVVVVVVLVVRSSSPDAECLRSMIFFLKKWSHWSLLKVRFAMSCLERSDDRNWSHNSNNGITTFRKKSANQSGEREKEQIREG